MATTTATTTKHNYVLTYFNSRGLAEISRFLFAAAGVEYKDVRIAREDWPALKPNTPFGQLPTLQVDGKTFGQSAAIARYIAREHGLYGANNVEALQIDSVVEALLDTRKNFQAARGIKDNETEKKAKVDAYFATEWPTWAAKIQTILNSNHEGKEWIVGNKISLADIAVHQFVNQYEFGIKYLAEFPQLTALVARVEAHPPIAAWVAKRPVTEF